ncbi:hypothetical protein MGA5115_03608 [Marinomonas gallaica]|uniref:Alpha-2-macroglobulin n=1 Tax=Marinomonas gallaica TaxID=1806667 RepID=A0A1C3JW73_9GAMM|nr:alpha-2-macroglobulin [Marinomonas gallaica]SBT19443.1 hypothetical protein MGA5115_03608 [Marinomonas gallaica]SBT22881.1 hypothetical protein MGA5116_03511 [Marinomonas gallaica]
MQTKQAGSAQGLRAVLFGLLLLCFNLDEASAATPYYLTGFSEVSYDQAPALQLTFTQPIRSNAHLSSYVSLTPEPEQGSRWITEDGKTWVLPFVDASTTYEVNVSKRLQAQSGARLSLYEPNAEEESEPDFPLTRTLTTKAYDASVNFSGQGNFINADLAGGLPVSVINVPEVQLQVFRVTDQRAFLNQLYNSQGFEGNVDYYNLDTLRQSSELVHTAHFPVEARVNQRRTVNLDISSVVNKYDQGIFVAVAKDPRQFDYSYATTFFALTDIGLQVRRLDQQLIAFTHSIKTASPRANIELEFIYRDKKRASERGRTDQSGVYQHVFDKIPEYVIATQGDEVAFLNLEYNGLDLSEFNNSNIRHQSAQAFLYGPRDLYRPGETVNVNALLRDYDGQKMRAQALQLVLLDAQGQEVLRQMRQADDTGLIEFEHQLSENAAMGTWALQVSSEGLQLHQSYRFKVEDFMPEMLALQFYDGDRSVQRRVQPDALTVPIQADYLYGAPASGNQVDAIITAKATQMVFEAYPDTVFGDERYEPKQRRMTIPRSNLDEKGAGLLDIPDRWQGASVPLDLTVSASVYESGGRPITRHQKIVRMTGRDKLPGIKALSSLPADEDQEVTFLLRSVSPDGQPVTDDLQLKLYRYGWNYHWEYDASRGWYREYSDESTLVDLRNVAAEKSGIEQNYQLDWGRYYLEAQSKSGAVARYYFRTTGSWWYGGNRSNRMKPTQIDMGLDQDHYAPGETAKLLVESPIGGDARLTVESADGVLQTQMVSLAKGENTLALDIDEDWNRHDVYVTLLALNAADQVTELAPERALGVLHLPILRHDSIAEIALNVPQRTEPNKAITAQIEVTNIDQLGDQKLYATVALVDRGVLNITGFKPPNPQRYFYGQRRYETDIFDTYDDIINNLGYDTVRQRFGGDMFERAAAEDDLTRGGEKPKSDVQIVSYFSHPVAIEKGKAEISFDLPNFNGRLEWMVVVYGDRSYGNATQQTIVADKVVTQVSMPRFLAMDDTSQLTFDVRNMSGTEQTFEVKAWVEGPLMADALTQTIDLSDREKKVLTLPVKGGQQQGQASVHLTVSNGNGIAVSRDWKLGVRSPYSWPTRSHYAEISAGQSWQPDFNLEDLQSQTVTGFLTLSNRPALNVSAYVQYLLQYPYGCLEQTTSSTYPWLLMDQAVVDYYQLQGDVNRQVDQAFSNELRAEQLEQGLVRLYKKQQENGSFGYWQRNSEESRWGTVYATELMVDARKAGFEVDQGVLKRALSRLTTYLKQEGETIAWSDSPSYSEFGYRAYSAYVLAKANSASLSDVRRLLDQVSDQAMSESGLAWMHLAAAFDRLKDHDRADESYAKAWQYERSSQRYYGDYGSSLRDLTLKLILAEEMGRNESSRYQMLFEALKLRRWLSTQDRIALLRLASQWTDADEYQFTWLTDANEEAVTTERAARYRLNETNMRQLKAVKAGDQRLFVSAVYQGAPVSAPEQSTQGIHVTRDYYNLDGKMLNLDQVKSGQLVIVAATLEATEESINDALYVDLLPAGLEPENQNLDNANVQLGDLQIGSVNLDRYFEYGAPVQYDSYQDDRYVAALQLEKGTPVKLFYLLRAVTPGQYQVPNAIAEDMYRPALQGSSAAQPILTVVPSLP